jgi:hypothetical protein
VLTLVVIGSVGLVVLLLSLLFADGVDGILELSGDLTLRALVLLPVSSSGVQVQAVGR